MGYKKATAFKMMPKSPLVKALTAKQEANLPPQLKAEIAAAPEAVAKLKTGKKDVPKSTSTVGGKSLKKVNSAADVPKSTSFGGTNYKLGGQDGAGPHYYNEGFSSEHEKQGTIKRPGDAGVYHVSRKTEKPVKLNKKPVPSVLKNYKKGYYGK